MERLKEFNEFLKENYTKERRKIANKCYVYQRVPWDEDNWHQTLLNVFEYLLRGHEIDYSNVSNFLYVTYVNTNRMMFKKDKIDDSGELNEAITKDNGEDISEERVEEEEPWWESKQDELFKEMTKEVSNHFGKEYQDIWEKKLKGEHLSADLSNFWEEMKIFLRFKFKPQDDSVKRKPRKNDKPLYQYEKGKLIKKWPCANEARKHGFQYYKIKDALDGITPTAYGYEWSWEEKQKNVKKNLEK